MSTDSKLVCLLVGAGGGGSLAQFACHQPSFAGGTLHSGSGTSICWLGRYDG